MLPARAGLGVQALAQPSPRFEAAVRVTTLPAAPGTLRIKIANDRNAIGHIARKDLPQNLKIVCTFPE